MNRRQFLKGLGAMSVLVASGGVYRAFDRGVFSSGTGPAFEPWTDWETEASDGVMQLVKSAILAANPHNTQPWLFQVKDNQVVMYADTQRHLGAMDPYLREMYIGLGCAVENMLLTAQAVGYDVALDVVGGELLPPVADVPMEKVATLTLQSAVPQPNALYAAISNRRTNRFNYAPDEPITDVQLQDLQAVIAMESDIKLFAYHQGSEAFQTLAQATVSSTEAIIADHTMAHDSFVWIDQSWEEMQRDKDGPYVDTSGSTPAIRALVKMLPGTSQAQMDAGWLDGTRISMENTALLGLIAVPNLYDKQSAIQAGRVWQRIHLWATTQNIAMQPINQAPEIVDRDRQLGRTSATAAMFDKLTGDSAWRPTFAFRMGHPTGQVLPSARRPVAEVLL